MVVTRSLLLALLLVLSVLGGRALGRAEPSPGQAVVVVLCVAQQDAERVARDVHDPVMKALKAVPDASAMSSHTTHGRTQVLVVFRDGATRNDSAAVEAALDRVNFASDVEILTRHVELAQPLADGSFPAGTACTNLRQAR